MQGLSIVDGTSVLLKFARFLEIDCYIQAARNTQQSYFHAKLFKCRQIHVRNCN